MKSERSNRGVLLKQFNMRMTDEMRSMLEQLAVDVTTKENKLVSPSEVMRRLINDAYGKRTRK